MIKYQIPTVNPTIIPTAAEIRIMIIGCGFFLTARKSIDRYITSDSHKDGLANMPAS